MKPVKCLWPLDPWHGAPIIPGYQRCTVNIWVHHPRVQFLTSVTPPAPLSTWLDSVLVISGVHFQSRERITPTMTVSVLFHLTNKPSLSQWVSGTIQTLNFTEKSGSTLITLLVLELFHYRWNGWGRWVSRPLVSQKIETTVKMATAASLPPPDSHLSLIQPQLPHCFPLTFLVTRSKRECESGFQLRKPTESLAAWAKRSVFVFTPHQIIHSNHSKEGRNTAQTQPLHMIRCDV